MRVHELEAFMFTLYTKRRINFGI